MSDFTPGVERARKAGYKIDVRPYVGTGEEQVQQSLDVIAQKIRDGMLDPGIRDWVGTVLKDAGRPTTRQGKVQAMLDAFRETTVYVADPVGAEYIVAAPTTICVRPGLCVRARDCDDGTVFMGSAIGSAGIPVMVLKQSFGYGRQEHVLVEAQMEDGSWLPADPSTELAVGEKVTATSEVRIDPMDKPVTGAGTTGPVLVTLGGLGHAPEPEPSRDIHEVNGVWTERRYGQWWVHAVGTGWVPVGTGDACCAACAEAQGKAGAASPPPEDDEPCSACEAYAEKMRASGKLAKYGISGASAANGVSGPLGRFRPLAPFGPLRRLGLGFGDTPSIPPVTPTPAPTVPTTAGVNAATVIVGTAIVAAVGGVAWGLLKPPAPRRRAA